MQTKGDDKGRKNPISVEEAFAAQALRMGAPHGDAADARPAVGFHRGQTTACSRKRRWQRDLLRHWSGKCAVPDLEIGTPLRASYIKPWSDCDDRKRLDMLNGFMLGPAYDAAFDAGLISFDDNGAIIVSPKLPAGQLLAAGISITAKLSTPVDAHRGYLAHHRESVFTPA